MKRSKRYNSNQKQIKRVKTVDKAVDLIQGLDKAGFDESIDVHAKTNIDFSKSEQKIRISVQLPHGTGKIPKLAVFAKGEKAKEAKKAGAELIYGEKDIEKIKKDGKTSFDLALAVPEMMPRLARIAKILGPKGLMPSPKSETVTPNIGKAIEALKKGKAQVKSDSGGCIHQTIGKLSYKKEELLENYKSLMDILEKQKPEKLKGKLIRSVYLVPTMGPGVRIQ